MHLKGNKLLIYLDQNWVSEIIKAGTKKAPTDFFNKLLNVLETGVSESRFACPTSQFHSSEALLDSRINNRLGEIVGKFSLGLNFNESSLISHQQLLGAASSFAGQEPPATPWWAIPFNKNPDVPIDHVPRQDQWNPLYTDGQAAESRTLRTISNGLCIVHSRITA